jgi:hypothetical protein
MKDQTKATRDFLPRVVTIPLSSPPSTPSRYRSRRGGVAAADEISHMTVYDRSTWSDTVYYRYHPIIWMLLVFMAVGLHTRYQTLFNEQDGTPGPVMFSSNRDDHIQRQTSGVDSGENPSDLSSLVMSLIQSEVEEVVYPPLPLLRGAIYMPLPEQGKPTVQVEAADIRPDHVPISLEEPSAPASGAAVETAQAAEPPQQQEVTDSESSSPKQQEDASPQPLSTPQEESASLTTNSDQQQPQRNETTTEEQR